MRSPWKVVSKLVFRREAEVDARSTDKEPTQSVSETAPPAPTAPHVEPVVTPVSTQAPIPAEKGRAEPEPNGPDRTKPSTNVNDGIVQAVGAASREAVSASTSTAEIASASKNSARPKALSSPHVESLVVKTSEPSFGHLATELDAEIQDLRVRLADRLVTQNALLRDLIKRYR